MSGGAYFTQTPTYKKLMSTQQQQQANGTSSSATTSTAHIGGGGGGTVTTSIKGKKMVTVREPFHGGYRLIQRSVVETVMPTSNKLNTHLLDHGYGATPQPNESDDTCGGGGGGGIGDTKKGDCTITTSSSSPHPTTIIAPHQPVVVNGVNNKSSNDSITNYYKVCILAKMIRLFFMKFVS